MRKKNCSLPCGKVVVSVSFQYTLEAERTKTGLKKKECMIASQTVQWGDIRVCSITRPFVVFLLLRLDIFFAQFIVAVVVAGQLLMAALLECWQFGCKSPLCKICLLFLLVWPYFLPSSMKNMERGSRGGDFLVVVCFLDTSLESQCK